MTNDYPTDAIWVNTTEAAEITGYNQDYMQQLARRMWRLPEAERVIKMRNRSRRYELWLPDLVVYIQNHGYGPRKPGTKSLDNLT
ncbi:MAG: hypothetical protein K8J31_02045 [Anaerolineae bacterium]|nr:hypothetical protein [Anaerolineae bacterium]